jgi:hypothetical protein
MIHEERMVDRRWQFDMTKVTGTSEICLSAGHTAVRILENIHGKIRRKYSHVLFIYGTQGRVIQAPEVGPVQVIKKDGIRDLLDRDTSDIFGGQDRKRYALDCRRNW